MLIEAQWTTFLIRVLIQQPLQTPLTLHGSQMILPQN